MKKITPDPPTNTVDKNVEQYMPLTSNDYNIPALLVDTQAPLDALHEAAAHRIRAATQLLENIASHDNLQSNPALLQDFAQLCVIPLRDGCDLLDVLGRRLQEQLLG
ncbi:hypothetical protein [Pseudomonas protegens]|uniref:hypothetical protein n=1 Tax=Pseudomonas protegens TaxID=380021 RepID=UPI001B309749|nr:hypothetical protein [Pseudomonas protegens]MBP5098542.1 hypothetical protein [Pseudomonas protegens]MBP5114608.1 hypothetical protein [Pseudomonas protegens]MBP5127049.1 hypothetical protein [Pseudomonas protegens]QTU08742.1 hypothetical protein HUT25_24330 [Pseudomonas protegens]QTU15051.1 hypothetical protein HUT23_25020 [Pseudomonas protegens]